MGPTYLLSVATSVAYKKIDAMNLLALNSLVDSYNIMMYDYTSGAWGDKFTGH